MADNINATPWMMYRHELISYLSGGRPNDPKYQGLQIVPVSLDLLWDDPDYGTFLAWSFANNIPLWGDTYQESSGNRVEDAYFQFLTNIDAPATNPQFGEAAKKDAEKMAAIKKKIDDTMKARGKAWKEFNEAQEDLPPEEQISYKAWYAENYGPQISTLQSQFDVAAAQFVSNSNKAGGGYQLLGQALNNYNNDAFKKELKDQTGATLRYRTWTLVPELSKWIAEAKTGAAKKLSLTINTRTATDSKSVFSGGGNAGFSLGFIGVQASGGYKRTTINTSQTNFSMSFSSLITPIQILPGQWYSQQVLQTFKNGPFIPTGPFGPGKAVFWGEKGTFALSPVIAYAAYKPTVKATVDAQAYKAVSEAWSARAGLSIGPFFFGGKAGGSKDTSKFDSASRTFTLTSNSEHPQLIAMLSNVMPGN
ncbi:MAG TPA: hypothetical protein DCE56_05115 [Cyanobacteria bacterium UBA8553]|nr:hypothetical protein [Cyanobacteria bacterium UBA8553]HAJ60571.1 hypothetical protein [Cyanobacteria bacterium UBA8543]